MNRKPTLLISERLEVRHFPSGSTELVRDINDQSAGISPSDFAEIGGILFFAAFDDAAGRELWKSDGTEAGTVRVKESIPGTESSGPAWLTAVHDTLFFTTFFGEGLWKSDGTEEGTTKIGDPQLTMGPVPELIAMGENVFFAAHGDDGAELWSSDGTKDGTRQVTRESSRTFGSRPEDFTTIGSELFFTAVTPRSGRELWRTDGTPEGTAMLRDIRSGPESSLFEAELTAAGGNLFFVADDGASGRELWMSDGTELGTVRVKDILPGAAGARPRMLTAVEDTLFFEAQGDLWKSDGSTQGTTPVTTLPVSLNRSEFANVDGTLFFTANSGSQLWKSDGTAEGTVAVTSEFGLFIGAEQLTPFGGELYFSAVNFAMNPAEMARSLWRSDGTAAGTQQVKRMYGRDSRALDYFTPAGDTLFFRADDEATGRELWRSDGTELGTSLVKDIKEGSEFSLPAGTNIAALGNTVFFTADDGDHGSELWKSDGTELGTVQVADIRVGPEGSSPAELMAFGDVLLFTADDGETGRELWQTDGTTQGTHQVSDIGPGIANTAPLHLTATQAELYFSVDDGVHGQELWSLRPLSGDTDLDGDVDFADFLKLASNFGVRQGAGYSDGDFDGDGKVEFSDFLILAENFDKTSLSA